MAKVNAILQMQIEGVLKEAWVKTGTDNVIVDESSGKTLTTRLAELAADISGAVAGGVTVSQVQGLIDTAIDGIIDNAPAAYDTLKEIATYIEQHEEAATALNAAIGNKVDKVEGKGLSANDFTDALLEKLNAISTGANKVAKSETNGNIKIDDVETVVYTHPTGDGNTHLPSGGTAGQVLRASGSGVGSWGTAIRSGASTPEDLADGELFVKLVE